MDEKRKKELRQLLKEAMENVVIRYGYQGPTSIPKDVYKRYLQEHWQYYGADFFSCSFSARITPDLRSETTRLKLREFIRKELAQYIKGDNVLITPCDIETDSSGKSRLHYYGFQGLDLHFLIERLLEIAIDRDIEEAVAVFDRRSCSDGAHDSFHDVALLDGIKIERLVQVCEGVQLIPLPSREISDEIGSELYGISYSDFRNQKRDFFGKTMLVIERPGFTLFRSPSEEAFQDGTGIEELPFQVEVHDVKFANYNEVASFKELFCQALSLVCNVPVRIFHQRWFLAEKTSFNPHSEMSSGLRYRNPSAKFAEVKEGDIEKAKRLYHVLDKNSDIRAKLRIPIDRWIKSKINKDPGDKIIDLGIALEAFYVTSNHITKNLYHRAPLYLGEVDEEKQTTLKTEFEAIYDYRSAIVHNKELKEDVQVKEPFVSASELVARAQNLCRKSIMKVLDEGKFPNWDTLRQDVKNR